MAHKVPASPGLSRSESILDIVDDLKLLRVPTEGLTTESSIKDARESMIRKLKKANGTLNEGYKRILRDLDQTREQRCILQQNYEKIKDVLQETQAISSQEKDYFLAAAEERTKDIENKRFIVLIAGKNLSRAEQTLYTEYQPLNLSKCTRIHKILYIF